MADPHSKDTMTLTITGEGNIAQVVDALQAVGYTIVAPPATERATPNLTPEQNAELAKQNAAIAAEHGIDIESLPPVPERVRPEEDVRLRAASEFVRDVIEALGEPQPPLDAVVNLPEIAMRVVGQIERYKVEAEQAEQTIAQLREEMALVYEALTSHMSEVDDPCEDRGVNWPCDVARALAAYHQRRTKEG